MPSNHLILCRLILLPPSIFPSIRVFSNESVLCITWPKYWSFSFKISPSNEYSGLISFRIDWFDLLAVHLWVCISNCSKAFGVYPERCTEKLPLRVDCIHRLEFGEVKTLRVPWTTGKSNHPSERKSVLNIHWKD